MTAKTFACSYAQHQYTDMDEGCAVQEMLLQQMSECHLFDILLIFCQFAQHHQVTPFASLMLNIVQCMLYDQDPEEIVRFQLQQLQESDKGERNTVNCRLT